MRFLMLFILMAATSNALANECIPATKAQIEHVRSKMELQLLDAESARFKDVCVMPHHKGMLGERAYCGLINAKNSYGAFIGYTEFSYVENAEQATLVDKNDRTNFSKAFFRCTVCTPEKDCNALLPN